MVVIDDTGDVRRVRVSEMYGSCELCVHYWGSTGQGESRGGFWLVGWVWVGWDGMVGYGRGRQMISRGVANEP